MSEILKINNFKVGKSKVFHRVFHRYWDFFHRLIGVFHRLF